MRKPTTLLVFIMTIFSGCALLLPSYQADKIFILAPQTISFEPRQTPLPYTLLVEQPTASRYLDSQRVLYTRDNETLPAYQFALWSEPPTDRLTGLLVRAYESRGSFNQVTAANLFVKADYLLRSEIVQVLHLAESQPGVVVVSVRSQILRFNNRSVLASKLFSHEIPAETYDAQGAVHAMGMATEQVIREIVAWTEETIQEQPANEESKTEIVK